MQMTLLIMLSKVESALWYFLCCGRLLEIEMVGLDCLLSRTDYLFFFVETFVKPSSSTSGSAFSFTGAS